MRYVVTSASSSNAIAPFSGPALPCSWLEEDVPGMPHHAPDHGALCCSMPRVGTRASQARHVQAGAWSSWAETSRMRCRTCTVDVRAAHGDKRCHSEVGAPAKQDCRAAQRRHMSRRPRTETSSWYVDPWSPLCPSIADHHGSDERSMPGVFSGSRAGTKLGICHSHTTMIKCLTIHALLG
jgi:hypothetical protein